MKTRNAEMIMAAIVIARSTSFIASKTALGNLAPLNLLGVRFLTAFVLLILINLKRIRQIDSRSIRDGFIIGALYTGCMVAEMYGLKFSESAKVAFLENTAIVFVPIVEVFLRRKLPNSLSGFCSFLAIVGVGFLTLKNGISGLNIGDFFSLLAAAMYTAAIITTDRLSKDIKESSAILVGVIQVGTMGILSMSLSLLFESPVFPQSGMEWITVLWLAIVCTGFGFSLQPLAQKFISSERASTISALNPLGAGILGAVVFKEEMGVSSLIGATLVMTGILLQSKQKDRTE